MKLFKLINDEEMKNKKIFIFITILLILGFIAGTLYITILSDTDKNILKEAITNYFTQIKSRKLNNFNLFINSLTSNIIYIFIIWLLGISIIGLPIIICIIFYKSFVIGFSITSIIYNYKIGGIPLSITYSFPHQLLNLIIISFLSLYSIKVSISIIKMIVSKKQINFKKLIKKHTVVLLICIFLALISSLLESYLSPILTNLFSSLIK